MYSIFKNTILKKLKFIVAGILLITILPGNAGVKNDGRSDVLTPENFISSMTEVKDSLESQDKVSETKVSGTLDDSSDTYEYNFREISPTSNSFNIYMHIK